MTLADYTKLPELAAGAFDLEDDIGGARITDPAVLGVERDGLTLKNCLVITGQWSGKWPKAYFDRCLIAKTDVSTLDLSESRLVDTEIQECKLVGVKLGQSVLKKVILSDCKADFIQFQDTVLSEVRFERCHLATAFFNSAKLVRSKFIDCDLTGADFSGCALAGTDLRGSKLDDIKIDMHQLRNVIVTADQALYLATLMGLKIES